MSHNTGMSREATAHHHLSKQLVVNKSMPSHHNHDQSMYASTKANAGYVASKAATTT
jgi:hypothetical protein